MKLLTAINRFGRQLKADGKAELTRTVYSRDLLAFQTWAGRDIQIATITPGLLARFLTSTSFTQAKNGKPKAVISQNRAKSVLRSFFRFLFESGHLKTNPARLIRLARHSRRPPQAMTDLEIQALLKTLRSQKTPIADRDTLIFSLFLGTGIRLGSLVALNRDHVDLDQGVLRINGKNSLEQIIFLSSPLRKLLKSYFRRNPAKPGEPLFLSRRGNRIGARQVELRFGRWLEQAKIPKNYSVHTLRHSFATRLYEKTSDLHLVQRALGHKQITTTQIYAQIADRRLKRAVQSLASKD